MNTIAYLQHGEGQGPFRTEAVAAKNEFADRWLVLFEGKWRRVHVTVDRLYINYLGTKITVVIEGV